MKASDTGVSRQTRRVRQAILTPAPALRKILKMPAGQAGFRRGGPSAQPLPTGEL
ncbi:hypothetical protein HMPREF1051_0312 [Neisseria sicca VK64]|uniref:Uncharacterized protein n=1 Tax=Neisseria sicca VK64 TaxID=1095748 RepID=I2NWH3_NEISI|nr:hypothetical protein HMPREF1051_0312 [Neisseria sicca VK64]